MSPENQGVFQLLKEAAFRRILAFFAAQENVGILGMLCITIVAVSITFVRNFLLTE